MSRYTPEWEQRLLAAARLPDLLGKDVIDELRRLHNAEGRVYHSWDHALDVLKHTMALPFHDLIDDYSVAAVTHDVVYTVGDVNNEVNSIKVLRVLLGDNHPFQEAEVLISHTRNHMVSSRSTVPEAYRDFMDCDLATLGQPWHAALQYDYEEGKERLLAGWPVEQIAERREKFMQTMLAKDTIYLGHHFSQFEWQARVNIRGFINYKHDFSGVRTDLGRAQS